MPERAAEQRTVVQRLLTRVLALRAELGEPAAPVDAAQLDDDPLRASFEAAALAPIGPLDAQHLLELDDPCTRFEQLEGDARRCRRGAGTAPGRRLTARGYARFDG